MREQNDANRPDKVAEKMLSIRAAHFDKQLDLIDDPCDRKVVLCPRRAGKTRAFAAYAILTMLEIDQARVAFVAITRGHAKEIIWDTVAELDRNFQLHGKFNQTELTYETPNGSRLRLYGADTAGELEKHRGKHYHLVIVDEAGSFYPGLLKTFIYDIIEPSLHDAAGTLVVGGTPAAIPQDQFYDMASPKAFQVHLDQYKERRATSRPFSEQHETKWSDIRWEWSFHKWTTADNMAMPHIWPSMKKSQIARGIPDSDPVIQREYYANWVHDRNSIVYNGYDSRVNSWTPAPTASSPFGLPEGHEWKFVCGMDLGYDDDFDLEVAAYSDTCQQFYHVYGFASPGMSIEDIAKKYKEVEKLFGGFEIVVGDRGGLGKMIFKALSDTYGVTINPAEKSDKRDYIEILNSEFRNRHGYVIAGSTLEKQLQTVQWLPNRRKEDKSFANHACDAFLYLARHAYHHFSREPEVAVTEADPVAYARWLDEQAYQAVIEKMQSDDADSLFGGAKLYEHEESPTEWILPKFRN